MSIASEIQRINSSISTAYSVCENKGAALPQRQNSANLADTIDSIPQGSGDIAEKDVNFYDYDGALLYSFTFAEAGALTALPALPEHTGLTAQGWTHTLSQIRSAADAERFFEVGASYITDDGKTRLYMHLSDRNFLTPTLSLRITGSLTLSVDWGDGTVPDTISSTGTLTHTWDISAFPTDVVIEITPSGTGSFMVGGGSSNLFNGSSKNVFVKMLRKVEFGAKVQAVADYAFNSAYSLKSVVIPEGVTMLGNNALYNCYSLECLIIPRGATQAGDNMLTSCVSLSVLVFPETVTNIGSCSIQLCYCLKNLVIPNGVTQLENTAITRCCSLRRLMIPDSVTSFGNNAVDGNSALQALVIPKNTTQLGEYSLCGLTTINSISVPSGVTAISKGMFRYDYSLEEVILPNGLTSIGDSAFEFCDALREIVIPASVTSIGTNAFAYNYSLYTIDMSAFTDPDALPALAAVTSLFNTPNSQVIYVANQTMLTAFSSATNWSNYARRFQIKGA